MGDKVKLKGHESFSIREGWLAKGIYEIQNDARLFSSKNATDILGIGTNMVKALKYWLLASNLIEEDKKKNGYILTEIGRLIYNYDPYFEDIFTLYMVHLQIVTNYDKALIWNIFFNKCNSKNVSKRDLLEQIKYELDIENKEYNEKMLIDEISVLLKTYIIDERVDNPENNFTCPLSELGLLKKVDKENYQKEKSTMNKLNFYIVYYTLLNLCKNNSINIEELLKGNDSPSKLLNLDKIFLNDYLEILKRENLITINRTAGLNMVYIEKIYNVNEIFEKYFKKGD